MEKGQNNLQVRLISTTGVFIACLFTMMAAFRYGNSSSGLGVILMITSLPIFVLSLMVLLGVAWRGVTVHGMDRMEAWWWLSTPYSVAFPLSMLVFQLQEFGHALALFVFFSIITTISSGMWMVATIYQVAASQGTSFTAKKKAMLALVALVGILWAILRANSGG